MKVDFTLEAASLSAENKLAPLKPDVIYDVLIIGGGPAALTAAVYCMRKGVKAGLVTQNIGGQVAETSGIENYLGFRLIEGAELVEKFKEQIKQFELGFSEGIKAAAVGSGDIKTVTLEDGSRYQAKTLIVATGKTWRKLNVPGEKELTGKGVAYCAICDVPLFYGKKVAVVGGGNSGIQATLDLVKVAKSITIIQIIDHLTADKILLDRLRGANNVETLLETEVVQINGKDKVEAITVYNRKLNQRTELPMDGVFVEIGLVPNTDLVKDVLMLNQFHEINVDCVTRTSEPGIFAAGDVTAVPFKQIIVAAGEGCKAALAACDYVFLGDLQPKNKRRITDQP